MYFSQKGEELPLMSLAPETGQSLILILFLYTKLKDYSVNNTIFSKQSINNQIRCFFEGKTKQKQNKQNKNFHVLLTLLLH